MFGWSELVPVLPEVIVMCMACVVLLTGLFTDRKKGGILVFLTIMTMIFAAILTIKDYMGAATFETQVLFNETVIRDSFGDALKVFVYLLLIVVAFYSKQYLRQIENFRAEFFALLLFATLGIMVMISGYNLITLYLGLELLALCSYALVAYNRNNMQSNEAAMKYFVLGGVASGMLLYGMSMVYGAVGSLGIEQINASITDPENTMLVFGLIFVLVGVAFKLGAAPFHMWVPDVYQGAPTAATLFIASAPKIAAFALAVRLLGQALEPMFVHWQSMVAILALLSIIIGNLFALQQDNLKRLFAYSTISHIGFMLLGLVGGTEGIAASMFYIIVYSIMAVGGFGMIVLLSHKGYEAENISDFKGLNQRNGWYAFLMLLLVASMAGFPPLIGFFSKLYVLKAVVDQGFIWLAAVAVVFAVIGAFYYLRIIKVMYFDEADTDQAIEANFDVKTILSINALAQLGMLITLPVLFQMCIYVTRGLL